MKNEDVPGYTELKNKLRDIRYELEMSKREEERIQLKSKLKEIRKEIGHLLYENKQKKEGRKI